MNEKEYKNSFNKISVSEDVINNLISKAVLIQDKKTSNLAKYSKFIIIATAIIATSIITVSAASYLNVINVFKGFYSQFFNSQTPEFNQSQKDFLEKYGMINMGSYSEDGMNLNIEGILGDKNFVFVKYSISYDHEPFIYPDAPELYIGDVSNKVCFGSGSIYNRQMDTALPNKINYSSMFDAIPDTLFSAKYGTFVMTSDEKYQHIGIDLAKTFNKHGISDSSYSQDFVDKLFNGKINISFDNKYGAKLTLNSIGFANSIVTFVVDSSMYCFKQPSLFLRNKKTGIIYSVCNEFEFDKKLGSNYYSFKIENVDSLKDMEIVMPKEYYFKFPLSCVDSTRNIDLHKFSPLVLGDIKITEFSISPISLSIDGYCTKSLCHNINLSIKLKDMTELRDFKNSLGWDSSNSFNMKVPFESPIMLDSIKSVVIKYGDNTVEIPIE